MACHSIEPRDCVFVKGYGFLYFAKNMEKNIGKNLKGKHIQLCQLRFKNFWIIPNESATDVFKFAPKRVIQKTAETTSDIIANKIADVVAKSYAVAKLHDKKNEKIAINPENTSHTK